MNFTQVSQHESAWFALRCNDWFGLRFRNRRDSLEIVFNETRSACQLFHNLEAAIAESDKRCIDRLAQSVTDADSFDAVSDWSRSVDYCRRNQQFKLKDRKAEHAN